MLGYRTLSVVLPIGGHGVMPDQSLSEEDGQEYSLECISGQNDVLNHYMFH